MWLQFGYRVPGEYILLDGVDMFPGPVVSLALGLNVVASWGRGSVDYGTRDVSGLVTWG